MQNYASLVPRIIREPSKLAYYIISENARTVRDLIVYLILIVEARHIIMYFYLSRLVIDLPHIED